MERIYPLHWTLPMQLWRTQAFPWSISLVRPPLLSFLSAETLPIWIFSPLQGLIRLYCAQNMVCWRTCLFSHIIHFLWLQKHTCNHSSLQLKVPIACYRQSKEQRITDVCNWGTAFSHAVLPSWHFYHNAGKSSHHDVASRIWRQYIHIVAPPRVASPFYSQCKNQNDDT